MRVLSRPKLTAFWTSRKADASLAKNSLETWYKLARKADWENWAGLKQTFGTADRVGSCVVFDVANNHFRLIARVNFKSKCVFVLRIMDHKEYDKNTWPESCGCHQPPPRS